jgi:hypothetical protein
MPRYRITDSTSGRTLLVEGDAPPTEADAEELFASSPAVAVAPPPDSANAAQSIDESANPAYSPAASSWRNPYALDTGRPIEAPPATPPTTPPPAPPNRELEMKRKQSLGLSREQRADRDAKSKQISQVEEAAMRVGVPVAAMLAAYGTGGLSLLAGAAGGFTGEVLAQESEMARGARDQASYGQMVAAPVIAGTPLGPTLKGAAYAKDALIAARPAAIATRAAFGGGISGGADAISQVIDTGEVDSAGVLKSAAYGALFGGVIGGVETLQTTRAMKAALFAERKRTGDFKSTDLDLVGKMQRSWQRGRDGRGGPRDDGPDGGAGSVVPDQARPVDQVQLPPAGLPPFDPTRSARDIVLPPVPPRPSAPVAPVPPSAPAQVAPPEPLPAPVDNAPVVANLEPASTALQLNHDPKIGWTLYTPEGKVVNQLGHVNGGKDQAAAIEEAHAFLEDNGLAGTINLVDRPKVTRKADTELPPSTSSLPLAPRAAPSLPKPAAPVPGTPADEFGALHGPKLAPDAAQKFRDTEFQQDLGTTDGIDYKIETRGNKLWLTASRVAIKGRGADYVEQGIAYLQVDQAGNTILNGSFTNPGMKDSPLAIGAKAKMIAFINDMAATSLPEPAALAPPETPPAPVTVPPAAPPSSPGFPAAVVLTGATSRPAPLTVPPAAPEVKPASRRQIAAQRAEIRRLTKLADQAAQSSPERAGQYTAQAQQAREKLGEMESNTITGPTPQVGPDPQGNADLLTQIAEIVGKINMTPPANSVGGEYDGLAAAFSRGAARLLRSSKGGANIVNAIEELNAAAGTQFTSPSQFFEAVDRAVSNRQNVARNLDAQAYRDKVEAMAQTDTKKGRPRALVPSTPNVIDEVGVGGEWKLNKEKFSVVDTDEGPGGIILYIIQDGHRFTIPEGTPIYPDKGSLKLAEVAPQKPAATGPQSDDPFGDNFVPEPDVPAPPVESPADAKYRLQGEKMDAALKQQRAEADAAEAAKPPELQDPDFWVSEEVRRIALERGLSIEESRQMHRTSARAMMARMIKRQVDLGAPIHVNAVGEQGTHLGYLKKTPKGYVRAGDYYVKAQPTPGTQADLVAGIERQAAAPAAKPTNTGEIIPTEDVPFNLSGETQTVQPSAVETARAAQESAVNRARNEAAQRNLFDNPGEAGMVREDAPAPQSQNPAAAAEAVGNLPGAAGGLDLPNAQGEAPAVALSRPPRGLKEIEAAIMRGTIDRDRAAALFNRWFDVQAGKAEWQQFWDRKGNPSYLSITDAEAQALSRAVAAFDQGTTKFKWPSTELRKKGGATGGHWSDPGPNDAEAGRIDTQLLFPLARAVVGGIAGYLEGDTPEEKLAYALAGGLGLGLLGSRRLARRTLAALKPARAPVPSYPFDPGKPLRAVNAQGVVVGSHTMGALEHVRAIEMPELVHLARQLSGNDVGLRNFPKASGMFKARGADFRIELDRRIFSDPVSAQRTMAHELGHMIDYLDDQTMNRGNLLGRIAVLRDHLATTLPDTPWNPNQALQPKERVRLRRDAEKEVGKRPAPDDEAALAAWKEAVAEEYVLLVQDEIESRGLIRDQEVRAELIGITEWWRPYEADKVSAGYIDYRNSSVELYADALSVLFNAPSELRDRAPLFFDSWMAYLDRKPEAKRALQDAWHFLHQGPAAVVAARDDRIKAGFVKAEEFLINHARERELDRTTLRGIVDQTKQEWWNIYQPIIARGKEVKAAGVKLPWHKDPEFFFDAHALAENENYLLLERLQRTVVAPLEASGQTREDLGLYLFHNRVLNERYTDREGAVAGRSVIANPDGITPIQARMKLMLQRVPGLHSTPEQRVAHRARLELLESSARQVQDAFADLVRNGHQAGVFSDAQLALTEANRYAYAPFAVVDYLLRSDHVPAGIKQQVGTLQKVANPYLTFVLKGMAVAKLTELNRAKTLTVDLLNAHFPDSIERAPERKVALADGSMMALPPPPAPRGKTTLTLLRKGKLEAYYVEPAYTKMFDDQMPASAHIVAKVLNYTMRNFFHPLFITYNPGFVYAANPMSDNLRSYYALPPGAARRKWIAENRAVWESARSRVAQDVATQDMPRKRALVALRKQRPLTPAEATELKTLEARGLAYEAIATRALASPADSFAADAVNQDDLWSRMLREHALLADEPGRVQALTNKYLPTVVKTAKMIERHGMMSEALPKLAAYGMLGKTKGWSKEETAFYVRNQIGTPNVYKKGSRAVFNGSFLPYINVFTRGMEADVALLRGKTVGPESRSRKAAEFWRRMTEASFVPSLLQALAMVGVFGAALKKVYDGFSDYDKTNYLIIPLGTWETDTVYGYKSAGIRIRLTETMRFANAFLQHVVTRAADNDPAASASLAGLVEFGAGQVPGVHPLVTLGNSWAQFASGIQPRDSFRGSPVVQTADWKAGGWDRTKGMLAYTWGESGLGGMVRFDPKSQNIMEFSASATPVVNRLIRWSDSGLREREERIDKLDAEVIYKIRSQMPKVVNELLQEYSILKSMGERRDDRQEVRYKDLSAWHLKVWEPTYKEMKEAKPKDWSAYGVSLGIDSAPYGRGNQK